MKFPDWIKYWISKKEDNKFYHYWPDNTEFGPFNTYEDAATDCIKQAEYF